MQIQTYRCIYIYNKNRFKTGWCYWIMTWIPRCMEAWPFPCRKNGWGEDMTTMGVTGDATLTWVQYVYRVWVRQIRVRIHTVFTCVDLVCSMSIMYTLKIPHLYICSGWSFLAMSCADFSGSLSQVPGLLLTAGAGTGPNEGNKEPKQA